MKRLQSTMSAAELQAWRERHQHTLESGAQALGVGRSMFAYYLAGERNIPPTVAMLADALDELTWRRAIAPGTRSPSRRKR